MKRYLLIPLLALTAFLSCNKETEPVLPEAITVNTEVVLLTKAAMKDFTFTVSPADATFGYQVGNLDCQVKLQILEREGSGSTATKYYSLHSIEPVDIKSGTYKAVIRDLNVNDGYKDKVQLEIEFNDPAKGSTVVKSEPFKVCFSGTSIFSMAFRKEDNETAVYEDITLIGAGNKFSISSPFISSPELVMNFASNGSTVTVNGVEQVSGETVNDFSTPVTYKVTSEDGKTKEYVVEVTYSGLPVIFINTPGKAAVPSKHEDWLEGTSITLYNPDWTVNYSGTEDNIRGRGNSTWSYPKKPYALKLDSKAEILGMPKHKRWVLLANWMDRTILRNRISFAVAMKTDLAWTPHGEFVEVILNGKHVGNYYLCEHIKVDKNRVNIDELEDDLTDSGYIFELDTYFDEVNKFRSQYYSLPYMFKDPDEVNYAQFSFIQNYVNNMEASIYDNTRFVSREYTQYLDIDTFIDWWLVHELTGNEEPKHPKSSYMNKNTGGKLKMGPVWDFDWGTFMPLNKWTILNRSEQGLNRFYDRLFQDAQFKARAKERWNSLEPGFREIPAYIESEAARIKGSESMNHKMWPCNTQDVIGYIVNQDEHMTFEQAVSRMKTAYEDKLNWMDQQIGNW